LLDHQAVVFIGFLVCLKNPRLLDGDGERFFAYCFSFCSMFCLTEAAGSLENQEVLFRTSGAFM
jgi:hypothetical protein